MKVSRISLGCWNFGTPTPVYGVPGKVTEKDGIRLIHQAADLGINFIDNANRYTDGEAEEIQGKAMEGRRSEFIVATKIRKKVGPRITDEGLSRHHIMQEVENSLRRLRTDYIDLYQVHDVDWECPLEETLRAMDDLVRQGKVRYIGCSNFPAWMLAKSLWISDMRNLEKFVSIQPTYNLINREVEKEIQPLCVDQGVGMVLYSPLAGGILTGKYAKGAPYGSRGAANNPKVYERAQAYREPLARLSEIAAELGRTPSQVSLNWVIHRPAVSTAITGATRSEQLLENAGAVGWRLPEDVAKELEDMFL